MMIGSISCSSIKENGRESEEGMEVMEAESEEGIEAGFSIPPFLHSSIPFCLHAFITSLPAIDLKSYL